MLHQADKVEFLEGVKVKMAFRDGAIKIYDMARLFERYPQTQALRNRELFESGKLNSYGVIWNEDLDIDADTVYECGEEVGKKEKD